MAPTAARIDSSRTARHAAGEQQVGDVGAGNQQHERDRALHDQQHAAIARDEILVKGIDLHVPLEPVRRVVSRRDGIEIVGSLSHGVAVLETTDEPQEIVSLKFRRKRQRHPGFRTRRVREGCRHHRGDGVRLTVYRDRSADHLWIAAVQSLPQRVADRDHLAAVRHVVGRPDQASGEGRHAEDVEEVTGHPGGEHLLRLATAGDGGGSWGERRERAQGPVAIAQSDELRPRNRRQRNGGVGVVRVDQLCGVCKRQRLQQNGIDHAEDRRVGTDAQRQREYGGEGEDRLAQEGPDTVANVLGDLIHVSLFVKGRASGPVGNGRRFGQRDEQTCPDSATPIRVNALPCRRDSLSATETLGCIAGRAV